MRFFTNMCTLKSIIGWFISLSFKNSSWSLLTDVWNQYILKWKTNIFFFLFFFACANIKTRICFDCFFFFSECRVNLFWMYKCILYTIEKLDILYKVSLSRYVRAPHIILEKLHTYFVECSSFLKITAQSLCASEIFVKILG